VRNFLPQGLNLILCIELTARHRLLESLQALDQAFDAQIDLALPFVYPGAQIENGATGFTVREDLGGCR